MKIHLFMRTKRVALLCVAMSVACVSCETIRMDSIESSGRMVQQERPISNFQSVVVQRVTNLYLTPEENTGKLTVKAPDNILDLVETYVENNTLYVGLRKGFYKLHLQPRDSIIVRVSTQQLNELTVATSSSAHFTRPYTLNHFNLNVRETSHFSGAASVNRLHAEVGKVSEVSFEGDCQEAYIGADGVSDVSLSGTCQQATMEVRDVSTLDGEDFITQRVKLEIAGTSTAHLFVEQSLEVHAKGGCSVFYKGNGTLTDNSSWDWLSHIHKVD